MISFLQMVSVKTVPAPNSSMPWNRNKNKINLKIFLFIKQQGPNPYFVQVVSIIPLCEGGSLGSSLCST